MTRMTGVDWLARMTVMTGITGMTGMTEIEQMKQGTIMQVQGAFVSVKQLVKQNSSLLVQLPVVISYTV